jgi:hypothetical protein
LDLDSKVQSSEIIIRDKECFRVCNGQDRYQSRFHSMFGYGWLLLLSNLRRTKKSSEWAYKKNKKHVVVTERFLSDVVEEYGEHPVSSDGCIWYPHQA